jgi:hypothetical protein
MSGPSDPRSLPLESIFENPPARFRGLPFWSWNARMTPEEVRRQVCALHEGGMGGFFMHAREGLETGYLGREWMAAVREAVRTAKELGLGAWLYDEDRWPSGAAGGLVTKDSPEHGSKALVLTEAATQEELHDLLDSGSALYACRTRLERGTILALEPIRIDPRTRTGGGSADSVLSTPSQGERFLVFLRHEASPIPWYNGAPPPDNLNPDTVRRFTETTYRAYAEELSAEFGGAVPGIFTDEPNVSHGHFDLEGKRWIPWTDALPEFFKDRRGYGIEEVVPRLFFEGDAAPRARHDFWRTIGELFLRSFTAQIAGWCAANRLAFTGHFLAEGDLGMAIARGGFVMPHYVHMQIPGVDILGSGTDELLTVKQCTSVANQFGRQVMSETYGGAGWELTAEEIRRSSDWQAALGVTMRCQHLSMYSLAGARKRDFPPSFMPHNPLWKYNRGLETYFSRISAVLSEGTAVREVLVLHPLATAWTMVGALSGRGYDGIGIREANRFGERLAAFCAELLGRRIDFDFADETILSEHGRVELPPGTDGPDADHAGNANPTGDADPGGSPPYHAYPRLAVGTASYRVVIVPPGTRSLSASTLTLLSVFTAAGGHLIAFPPLPDLVDGAPAPHDPVRNLPGTSIHVVNGLRELFPLLDRLLPDRVRITDRTGAEETAVYCSVRRAEDRLIVFLVNTDRAAAKEITVEPPGTFHTGASLTGAFRVEEWDPLTGLREPIHPEPSEPSETAALTAAARLRLEPSDSALLVFSVALSDEPPHPEAEAGTADLRPNAPRTDTPKIGPSWALPFAPTSVPAPDTGRRTYGPFDRTMRRLPFAVPGGPANVPVTPSPAGRTVCPGPEFAFRRTGPNVLVLDECSWRIADRDPAAIPADASARKPEFPSKPSREFSQRKPVWKAQDELRAALGFRSIARNSAEQRYTWIGGQVGGSGAVPGSNPENPPVTVELLFEFRTDRIPEKPVRLLLEDPLRCIPDRFRDRISIRLNGKPQSAEPDGTYLDPAFLTYPIEGIVRGRNRLTLALPYAEASEIENCYLLGEFGVSREGVITEEPALLFPGDWCLQGYPHYAGGIVYRFGFAPRDPSARVFLVPGQFQASALELRVNGEPAGTVLWRSRAVVELTGLIRPGENEIELELTGSLRNMLGPLRNAGPAPAVTGWPAFITEGESYAAQPVTVPYGLFGGLTIAEIP